MKKLIGTVAVAALLATAAFADGLSFGSWGRGLFITGNGINDTGTGNSVTSWVGQSWGGPAPRTALAVSGSSDNVGFNLDIHGNGDGLGMGDNALIWVKPVEMVKIQLAAPSNNAAGAKNDQNWLRGDAVYGLWNWDRLGVVGSTGEGFIFPAILNKVLSVAVTPIDGLFVAAGFNVKAGDWGNTNAGPGPIVEHDFDNGNQSPPLSRLARLVQLRLAFSSRASTGTRTWSARTAWKSTPRSS